MTVGLKEEQFGYELEQKEEEEGKKLQLLGEDLILLIPSLLALIIKINTIQ